MKEKHFVMVIAIIVVICTGFVTWEFSDSVKGDEKRFFDSVPIEDSYSNDQGSNNKGIINSDMGTANVHYLSNNPEDNHDYSNVVIIEHYRDENETEPVSNPDDEMHVLQENRGNSIPVTFYNLSVNPYDYVVDWIYNYTYTNEYFNTDSNGSIKITYNSYNTNTITVRLYEVSSNYEVTHWTGNPQTISGITIPGLQTNKLYYFKFETTTVWPVYGCGQIMHP